jgi:putative DNA primase/helicase
MRFEDFAKSHGLLIESTIPFRWVSTPTEDHPRKRNGRYKFMGDVGWVQNWATMEKPALWKMDGNFSLSPELLRERNSAFGQRQRLADKAAAKAGWIMHQTKSDLHPYLKSKGFPEEEASIWVKDDKKLIVIPMRMAGKLVGCQLIDEQGQKKFLYGQITKGASFTIDARGIPILCEGFATALSVQTVMRANKIPYRIEVCFSAGNLKEIASRHINGFIVADNDPNGIGESVAKQTGKPYWISDTIGEDFNDYHQRVGAFKASQSLKKTYILASSAKTLPQSA